MNRTASIYQDMATRTGSSVYIGVVGPVRTGKSTFIKRFMQTQVIPHIENAYRRDRAQDELPQSGSGRTIMTAEPKFVPEEAVEVSLDGGAAFSVRLIDCVGYMVPGAVGQFEDLAPRMVMTPWFDHEIPMTEAAEIGTRKVITDHSTVGVVVTTDGSVTEIPRADYEEAEERVIRELQEIGKPFVVVLNSAEPGGARAASLAAEIEEKYGVRCMPVNCLELSDEEIQEILRGLLYEFPLQELDLFLPAWVEALPEEHPIKAGLYRHIAEQARELDHIRELAPCMDAVAQLETVDAASVRSINLGIGVAEAELTLSRSLFYSTLSEQSGLTVADDGDLLELLTELARVRAEYEKVADALRCARESGYGIVMPSVEELNLEDPEIVRQGGRYGVRMKASAPSIHMIRADIETVVSPIVGNEKQSEDMVNYLMQEFEGDTSKIWNSNIFGRSFHEIVEEDLQAKLKRMPESAQKKLREALGHLAGAPGRQLLGRHGGATAVVLEDAHGDTRRAVPLEHRIGGRVHRTGGLQMQKLVAEDLGLAEDGIHQRQDVAVAAEVVGQLGELRLGREGSQPVAVLEEHVHVGTAEPVDALLRVAHRAHVGEARLRQGGDNGDLQLVGILELVDHDDLEPLAVALGQLRMGRKRVQAPAQQIPLIESVVPLRAGVGLLQKTRERHGSSTHPRPQGRLRLGERARVGGAPGSERFGVRLLGAVLVRRRGKRQKRLEKWPRLEPRIQESLARIGSEPLLGPVDAGF